MNNNITLIIIFKKHHCILNVHIFLQYLKMINIITP